MDTDALKVVLITALPLTLIVVLCSIYIFRRKKTESSIRDAFKSDLGKSGNMANPLDVKGRIKYMLENPDSEEFYLRRPNDFSGNLGTKMGLKIILTAVIIFIIGILAYAFLFYKIP
jgi:hypothetical protein